MGGPGPEVSGHFGTDFVVPKCLVAEVSGSRPALRHLSTDPFYHD